MLFTFLLMAASLVGHVDIAVVLLDELQEADVLVQFGFDNGRPGRVFQVLAAAVGEGHQVFVVVIASAGLHRVQFVQVQLVHDALQQVFGHAGVVDDAQGVSLAAALHSLGYLLEHAVTQVVVNLHLGVLGELEGIGLVVRIVHPAEYHGQAEADDVVQIHQIALPLLVRQVDEASAHGHRQLDKGIIGRLARPGMQLHGQKDVVVGRLRQFMHGRQPHGVDKAAELLAEELADKGLLLVAQLVVLQQEDVLGLESHGHLVDGLLVFLGIAAVQAGDLLDELRGMFALAAHAFVIALGYATQGGHAHAEELVEVVGVDAQETQPLQQGYLRLHGFLQDTPVEVHPAQVPVDIGLRGAFLFGGSLSHFDISFLLLISLPTRHEAGSPLLARTDVSYTTRN